MSQCERLHDFVAGELSEGEADRFRDHLGECDSCPDELGELLQLAALEELAAEEPVEREKPAEVISLASRRRRVIAVAAVAVAAAAVIAFVFLRGGGDKGAGPEIAIATAEKRPLEMRLAHPGADRYRPYDVARSSGDKPVERVPIEVLAELAKRGDTAALAAAHLLGRDPERAAEALSELPETAASLSDRGVAAYLAGDHQGALQRLARSRELEPKRSQTVWNLAVVYRELGLPLAAAALFDEVAELGEPGWSAEARERATALRAPVEKAKTAYVAAYQEGIAAITSGELLPLKAVERFPGLGRLLFYDAVRAAPSKEAAEKLAPHAKALDAHYGGQILGETLRRAIAADWSRRAPLAETYTRLLARDVPARPELEAFFARARAAGADDIVLGAMLYAHGSPVPDELLEEFAKRAADTGDVWFDLLAAEQRAGARRRAGHSLEAIPILERALARCESAEIGYRCATIAVELLKARMQRQSLSSLAGAQATAIKWLTAVENHYGLVNFHITMGEAAAYADELTNRSTGALSRAHFAEALLRDPQCGYSVYVYQLMSGISVHRGEQARAERESALSEEQRAACEAGLDAVLAYTRGEVLARSRDDGAVREFRAAVDEAREAADDQGGKALFDLAEARALLYRDPAAARTLLERALDRVGPAPKSEIDKTTRGYSYAILALEASRRGAHDEVLARLAAELRRPAPEKCAVGLAWENGLAVAVRGSDGAVAGEFVTGRGPGDGAVPGALAKRLAGCEVVDVFARPPLYGQTNLLPAELAWRFVTNRTPVATTEPTTPRRVVIADVRAPDELELPPLRPWRDDGEADLVLRGAQATPERVLRSIANATEIEIHAHGLVSGSRSEAASIVLAEKNERYTLTATQVAAQKLTHPALVILGTCHAGAGAASFDSPWSLPAAFLEAGARTVIASPNPIPDSAAGTFFAEVRAAIRKGATPAMALRDVRLRWQSKPGQAWANDVLIFE